MASRNWEYDVFLSYARSDVGWVRENMYAPLLACRRLSDGSPPRVFLDCGDEGIAQGAGFLKSIAEALDSSRKIVLLYSEAYFTRKMCRWEMSLAFQLDPAGDEGRLIPVQLDPSAQVPFYASSINWLRLDEPGWFDRLCAGLALAPGQQASVTALQFLEPPASVMLNQALPPVRVKAVSAATQVPETEVSLSCEAGYLQGTLLGTTEHGVATFHDLAVFRCDGPTVRLVATAPGLPPCRSEPFAVTAPPTAEELAVAPAVGANSAATSDGTFVAASGEAVFLGDGSLAVAEDGRLSLHAVSGAAVRLTAWASCAGPLRLLRRGAAVVVGAEWDGAVHVLRSDGSARSWSPPALPSRLSVPADVQVTKNGTVVFGYWEGTAYSWPAGSAEPLPVLRHGPGVRCLATVDGTFLVLGFDGVLALYRDGRWVSSLSLDPSVNTLRAWGTVLVAVGQDGLHHVDLTTMQTITEDTGLPDVLSVLVDSDRLVVVASTGKGFCCDRELAKTTHFYVQPGAVPTSADNLGSTCVFRTPAGQYALVLDGVVALNDVPHGLAVSADHTRFAVAEGRGIRVVSADRLDAMLAGAGAGEH
jgi:hypothetical protein